MSDMQEEPCVAALWAVNAKDWDPSEEEFNFLVGKYCDAERAKSVRCFKFAADQRRALLSTLLQRKACTDMAGVDPSRVVLERTKGKKPYAVLTPVPSLPNFNFNATHDGAYVLLNAHSHYLCGIDLMQIQLEPSKTEFLESTLSPASKQYFNRLPKRFRTGYLQVSFAAKEAYTKAVGVGLMEPFEGISFTPDIPAEWGQPFDGSVSHTFKITCETDSGQVLDKGTWVLEATWVDQNHVSVMALGCPKYAVDAFGNFKSQLRQPQRQPVSEDGPESDGPVFGAPQMLTILDLVAEKDRPEFVRKFRPNLAPRQERSCEIPEAFSEPVEAPLAPLASDDDDDLSMYL